MGKTHTKRSRTLTCKVTSKLICKATWQYNYDKNTELFREDHCNNCDLSGVVEGTTGNCQKYIDLFSPNAVDWNGLVVDEILIGGFGLDRTEFYRKNGGLWYYNIEVNSLIARWKNHFLNGQNTNDDEIQETLFAAEVGRASLLRELAETCNWVRNRQDYFDFGSDRYRHFTEHHESYDNKFILTLIEKHKRLNEERRL